MRRVSTGLRYPPQAEQGIEIHRHFYTDGSGTREHAHPIGRQSHDHPAQRLSRVMLSWAEEGPHPRETSFGVLLVGVIAFCAVIWAAAVILS